MAETIESFVDKLQKEGIKAGEEAARKISDEAGAEADRIIEDAKTEAQKIVAEAEKNAKEMLERSSTEMELAARDVASRLRETLSTSLNQIISISVSDALDDPEFLKTVISEIVTLYATADKEGKAGITINVSKEMLDKLESWAVNELKKELCAENGASVDLKGTLGQAGFEYEVSGGTVEVTRDAVVDTLREMVSPALEKALQNNSGQGS